MHGSLFFQKRVADFYGKWSETLKIFYCKRREGPLFFQEWQGKEEKIRWCILRELPRERQYAEWLAEGKEEEGLFLLLSSSEVWESLWSLRRREERQREGGKWLGGPFKIGGSSSLGGATKMKTFFTLFLLWGRDLIKVPTVLYVPVVIRKAVLLRKRASIENWNWPTNRLFLVFPTVGFFFHFQHALTSLTSTQVQSVQFCSKNVWKWGWGGCWEINSIFHLHFLARWSSSFNLTQRRVIYCEGGFDFTCTATRCNWGLSWLLLLHLYIDFLSPAKKEN